jgi:hypothetical protein
LQGRGFLLKFCKAFCAEWIDVVVIWHDETIQTLDVSGANPFSTLCGDWILEVVLEFTQEDSHIGLVLLHSDASVSLVAEVHMSTLQEIWHCTWVSWNVADFVFWVKHVRVNEVFSGNDELFLSIAKRHEARDVESVILLPMELSFLHFLSIVSLLHDLELVEVKLLTLFYDQNVIVVDVGTGKVQIGYFLLKGRFWKISQVKLECLALSVDNVDGVPLLIEVSKQWKVFVAAIFLMNFSFDNLWFDFLGMGVINATLHLIFFSDEDVDENSQAICPLGTLDLTTWGHYMDSIVKAHAHHWIGEVVIWSDVVVF